jgi:DNA-binding PadR family transcriptional regulator
MYYDIFVLSSLFQKPMYGYEIRKNLIEQFSACTRISNNSLYPLLKKFEKGGYITRRVEFQTGKPNRIIYAITGAGKKYFLYSLNTISESAQYDRDEFFMRIVYFRFILPANRKLLLEKRTEFLRQALQYLQKYEDSDENYGADSAEPRKYHLKILDLELDLIKKYEQKIHDPCFTLK